MTPRLSKNKVGSEWTDSRSFDNNDFTHLSLVTAATIERYSASVEKQAIVSCLVELHGLAPRNMKNAPMEV